MKKKVQVITAFVFVVLMIVWLIPSIRFYPGVTVRSVTAEIEEQLPTGSTRQAVASYLSRRGIEHSLDDSTSATADAIFRNVCITAMLSCDIQVGFEFDDAGGLRLFTVSEVFTTL